MKKLVENFKTNHLLRSFFSFYKSAESDLTSIAVAYYLLISIFPILMTLANLLPYLPIDVPQVLAALAKVFPAQLYPTVETAVVSVLTQPSSSWLGLSILTTLWTFSKSMTALQKALNKAYGVAEHRDMIVGQIVSMAISIGLQVLLMICILLMTFGKMALGYVQDSLGLDQTLYHQLLSWTQPAVYGSFFLALVLLYFFLPNVTISKVRYVLPGAGFVTVTIAVVGNIFAEYVVNYAEKWINIRLVTSVVFLVLMLWFVFLAQVLIIGGVFNATYQSFYVDEFKTRRGTIASVFQKMREKVAKG